MISSNIYVLTKLDNTALQCQAKEINVFAKNSKLLFVCCKLIFGFPSAVLENIKILAQYCLKIGSLKRTDSAFLRLSNKFVQGWLSSSAGEATRTCAVLLSVKLI